MIEATAVPVTVNADVMIRAVVNDATPVPIALNVRAGFLTSVAKPVPVVERIWKVDRITCNAAVAVAKKIFCGARINEAVPVPVAVRIAILTFNVVKVATLAPETACKIRAGFLK